MTKTRHNGIHNMLRNPYYAGILVHRQIECPGEHQALITPELFDEVQNVLDGNNIAGRNKSWQHPHYLKGSLYRARCSERLCYSQNRGNGGTYEYCYCGGRRRRNGQDLPDGTKSWPTSQPPTLHPPKVRKFQYWWTILDSNQ